MSVVKDTKRADSLKDMVQAWETEQPGRTKKAQESRHKFLAARAIKDGLSDVDISTDGGNGLPTPPTGPVKIVQMDLAPFYVLVLEYCEALFNLKYTYYHILYLNTISGNIIFSLLS